ncbi:hypothetical protein ACPV5U_27940 [Vibrio mediterranei]
MYRDFDLLKGDGYPADVAIWQLEAFTATLYPYGLALAWLALTLLMPIKSGKVMLALKITTWGWLTFCNVFVYLSDDNFATSGLSLFNTLLTGSSLIIGTNTRPRLVGSTSRVTLLRVSTYLLVVSSSLFLLPMAIHLL